MGSKISLIGVVQIYGAISDKPEKNCSDVNELIDLHVSAIRENIIKQQKLIEQLSDLRGTCDGLCTIDQCGVLKNLA